MKRLQRGQNGAETRPQLRLHSLPPYKFYILCRLIFYHVRILPRLFRRKCQLIIVKWVRCALSCKGLCTDLSKNNPEIYVFELHQPDPCICYEFERPTKLREKNLTDHRESREYESYFKLQQVELTVVNKGLAIYSETIEGLQLRTNCNAANS